MKVFHEQMNSSLGRETIQSSRVESAVLKNGDQFEEPALERLPIDRSH